MSHFPKGKILKILASILFIAFMPLVLLRVGASIRNRKVILEGAIYFILSLAVTIPEGSGLYALGSFVGVSAVGISGVRLYMMRGQWLTGKTGALLLNLTGRPDASGRPNQFHSPAEEPVAPVTPSTLDPLQTLARVASTAKQNENRLPADAYASILQICRTLDSVVSAETRQPLGDPEFEYELAATVHEYLPTVLRSYLAIPTSMMNSRQTSGRTPNEELTEQLLLLSGQAETLHSRRHLHTSAELTTMGNFLRERFGHHQGGGFDFGIK
ncbi:hypothetical protein LJ756_13210 [Arthrobacter sp. zg-Y411]|uniref:hypothetical protein n=1 Tax=Arthrobacter zhangbolii TaxID=2886936 RepID=UPI001D141B64|nr:hypothetical protein [Arthrobacter zhangbolii]MCC3295579.1 hypothetical protein [Arthrobacter zhangbolii]